jgi:hypothetical protein
VVIACLVAGIVFACFEIVAAAAGREKGDKRVAPDGRPRRSPLAQAAMIGLSGAVIALLLEHVHKRAVVLGRSSGRGLRPVHVAPAPAVTGAGWGAYAAGAGIAVAAAMVLALTRRSRVRSEPRELVAPREPGGDELGGQRNAAVEALGGSLEALEAEPDPRRAVIAAYARMQRWLAEAGLGSSPWETPFEHLDRVFSGLGATAAVGASLAELFELAKFSHHACGPDMKRAALADLVQLRDELGRPT